MFHLVCTQELVNDDHEQVQDWNFLKIYPIPTQISW
jgi:hypothetical protein